MGGTEGMYDTCGILEHLDLIPPSKIEDGSAMSRTIVHSDPGRDGSLSPILDGGR